MHLYRFAYRHRGAFAALYAAGLLLCRYRECENAVIWPIGSGLFLLGLALRIWANAHLGYRIRRGKILTTTGPYRYVRNPLYIGNTIMLLALTVLSELVWMVPVTVAYCWLLYSLVVKYEEEHLGDKYGSDYGRYCDATPRWIRKHREHHRPEHSLPTNDLLAAALVELTCLAYMLPFVAKDFIAWDSLFPF